MGHRTENILKYAAIAIGVILLLVIAFLGYQYKQKDAQESAALSAVAESDAEVLAKLREAEEAAEESEAEAQAEATAAEQAEIEELAVKAGLDETDGTLVYEITEAQTYQRGGSFSLDGLTGDGLLVIDCVAVDSNATLSVTYTDGTVDYDIMTQSGSIYLPIADDLYGSTLSFTVEGTVTISSAALYDFAEDVAYNEIKSGLWLDADTYETIEVDYGTGINTAKSYAVVTDGTYIYIAEASQITIYQNMDDDSTELVGVVSDISGTREMEFTQDGNYLVATARSNGVYIIDISVPEEAAVITHLNSLELATGLAIEGDYMFVCSRYFGIEIYDISDPYEPVYCSVVRGEREYQNCTVDNGILYIAIFNECRLCAYDVTDPYNPVELWTITTDGKPYGITVADGVLYTTIAISDLTHSNSASPGYGLGNGFAIYDVSDPTQEPQKLSTARLDGRFDVGSLDIYSILVQDGYVYLSHTYNGVYVYDVSDLTAPVRVADITVPIYSYDDEFRTADEDSTKIFPYDRDYTFPDSPLSICLGDGCVYFACMYTGTYCVAYETIQGYEEEESTTAYAATQANAAAFTVYTDAYELTMIEDIDAFAVASYDGMLYIACGEDGVLIYDAQTYQYIDTIDVPGNTKDIQVSETGLIYAASTDGLYVYDAADITEIYTLFDTAIKEVQISDDGEYVLALGSKGYLLQLQEVNHTMALVELDSESVPSVYYRALCSGLVADRYVCAQTNSAVIWWDILAGETLDTQVLTYLGEGAGYAAYGDYCIAIYNNGYVYYDPTQESVDFSELTLQTIEGVSLAGKASVVGDVLVVTKEYNGEVWLIDISDIDNPVLLAEIETSASVDIASGDNQNSDDAVIYLPVRHVGVAILTRTGD